MTQEMPQKKYCICENISTPGEGRGRGPLDASYRAAMAKQTMGGDRANAVSGASRRCSISPVS